MKYRFLGDDWIEADNIDDFLNKEAMPSMEGSIFEDEEGCRFKLMYYTQHVGVPVIHKIGENNED